MSPSLDVQAFLVTFREALEAMLIVGLITSFLKKWNQEKYHKWVWMGASAGVIVSFFVALLFQVVLTGYQMMGSEIYLKISIMLISSILLTQMILWITAQNRNIHSRMEQRVASILTKGSIIGMI